MIESTISRVTSLYLNKYIINERYSKFPALRILLLHNIAFNLDGQVGGNFDQFLRTCVDVINQRRQLSRNRAFTFFLRVAFIYFLLVVGRKGHWNERAVAKWCGRISWQQCIAGNEFINYNLLIFDSGSSRTFNF